MNLDRFKFRAWDKKRKILWLDVQDYFDERDVSCFGDFFNEYHRDDYIIEQCIGLKDKNGNLIYEGDIVRTRMGRKGVVIWNEVCFCYRTLDKTECTYIMETETEVIGTIHDDEMV